MIFNTFNSYILIISKNERNNKTTVKLNRNSRLNKPN